MSFPKPKYKQQTKCDLLSLTTISRDEFIKQYKKFDKTKARELCLQVFTALEQTIHEGNVDSFKKTTNLLSYIKSAENSSSFTNYYKSDSNPLKKTNLIILACKHKKTKILEQLFRCDSILLDNISPDTEDETHHNAFYYATRSGDVDLLDTLISEWPGKYFTHHPNKLDEILSKAYEELQLRNVPLSNEIIIFVETQLINFRFFAYNSEEPKQSISNIIQRIKLVLADVSLLTTEYANAKDVDQRFLFVAKHLTQNIHILKHQLKSTYIRLPWEEIEFCLVSFISCHVKRQEINLFYHITLRKEKILNHLEMFAKHLAHEMANLANTTDFTAAKLAEPPKFKRNKVIAQMISKYPEFEILYNDYQQIRDISSLKKLNNYIELSFSADPKTLEGKLIITRVLQMIGEYVKDTLESPKLSVATNELLLLSLPRGTRQIIVDLRNSLSHAYSLAERTNIEENQDVHFFTGIQNDIKQIGIVISDILYNNKINTIRTVLKAILDSKDLDEVTELLKVLNNAVVGADISKDFTPIEHRLEGLIDELNESISEQTNHEKHLFTKIYELIYVDKTKLAVIKNNYQQGFTSLKVLYIFSNRINKNTIGEIKSFVANTLTNITSDATPYEANEIVALVLEIFTSLRLRMESEDLEEIHRIVGMISYLFAFGIGNFKWIEELREKLNERKSPIHRRAQPEKCIEQNYESQLRMKLSNLRSVLSKRVLGYQFIENVDSYKSNKKTQAVIEMLVLDIMSILSISKKYLGNNLFFLDGYAPLLIGKCLRNHLAHDNAVVEILSSDPSISVILNAKRLITEEEFTNKKTNSLREDLAKLRNKYDQSLITIKNQEMMFVALENGNLDELMQCLKNGADIYAKSNDLWGALHFAAKGANLEIIKFLLSQNVNINAKDINNQGPLHIAAAYGRSDIVQFFIQELHLLVDDKGSYGKTPLHVAAQSGHKDTVEILLKNKANTRAKDFRMFSPLHYAVENNHRDVVQVLLKNELNVDINMTGNGSTALHIAAKNNHLELVEFFLRNNANVNPKNNPDGTPIHAAAQNGYLEIVSVLIANGADVNFRRPEDGCTPLYYAIQAGQDEVAKILLKHGANVNVVNKLYHSTPLHYAANFGREAILSALLKNNTNVNVASANGLTPLHLATQNGHTNVVKILLKHGANIRSVDKTNATSLHIAASRGHTEVVEVLIKNGAEINAKTDNHSTPLFHAAMEGHVDVVALLIKNNADVNARDLLGSSPLHAVAMTCKQDIIEILIKNKADINARTKDHFTPLHFSALKGHIDAVNFLLKYGADVNAADEHGNTPLHAAVLQGHTDVVRILIKHNANMDTAGLGSATALHLAAESGTDIVKILVDNGANVNAPSDYNNMAPLSCAVRSNRKEIVETLIANGADINSGEGGPLMFAVLGGFKGIVDILLQNQVDIHVSDGDGYTPLHLAATRGHTEIAYSLIQKGANVNAITYTGSTLLHVAVKKGHIEFIEMLLENGININAKTNEGTPLHLAIEAHGRRDIIEVLLKHGSDISIKDTKGRTALELAIAYDRLECVKTFLEHKTPDVRAQDWRALHLAVGKGNSEMITNLISGWYNVNDTNSSGQTMLQYIVMEGQLEIVKYLISKGADVNAQDANGLSPLHIAAQFGFKDIIEVLLENGAIYNSVDKHNRKPLDLANGEAVFNLLSSTEKLFEAVQHNSVVDVENCIKKGGAFLNTKSANDLMPLHIAAAQGYTEIVESLLKNNANPNVSINSGYTPLHYATKCSHVKIVKALLSAGAVYNMKSVCQETPLDLSVDQDIVHLLKLINKSFIDIENGKLKVISDLNKITDIGTMKAIMNARNEANQTLVIYAIHIDFPRVDQLKAVLQDDVCTRINVAKALCLQEKYPEALRILTNALEKRKEILGPNNPGTLDIEGEIASVLYKQQNYQEALDISKHIYEKQHQILGMNNKDTLYTRSLIALILHRQGKNNEAYNIYEEVYQRQRDILGNYHLDVLKTQMHIGLVLDKLDKFEEALDMNYDVLEKETKVLGKNHPGTLCTLNNIAMVLNNEGKHDESIKVYEKVYEAKKIVLGPVHSDTLRTLHNKIGVLSLQKKYDKALQAYEELLNTQKTVLGPGHLDTLNTQYNIGNCLLAQGNLEDALKTYTECFERRKAILGETHPDILQMKFSIEMLKEKIKYKGFEQNVTQKQMNLAASNGDEEQIRHLLQNDSNVNNRDSDGRSPLHYAVSGGHLGVVKILLSYGANATQATNKGNTTLHSAAIKDRNEILEVLLHHVKRDKLDNFINAKTTASGTTALHVAAEHGCFGIVKTLLKYGAAFDIENNKGKTPLELASERCVNDLLKVVNEMFIDARNGNIAMIGKLQTARPDEFSAITNARNNQGSTLLQTAIVNKNKTLAAQLIRILKT